MVERISDQETRNIIDKLANFVARNGPEFEQMTMTKQQRNPKFSFLFSGSHHAYYKWKVATEQGEFPLRVNVFLHCKSYLGQLKFTVITNVVAFVNFYTLSAAMYQQQGGSSGAVHVSASASIGNASTQSLLGSAPGKNAFLVTCLLSSGTLLCELVSVLETE